nr:hypothetical protein [Tanacetum cinerariifolium]
MEQHGNISSGPQSGQTQNTCTLPATLQGIASDTHINRIVSPKWIFEIFADAKIEAMKEVDEMETKLAQLKLQIKLKDERALTQLEMMRNELEKNCDKENEAQVEIALLKAELHKGRSKGAVAKAAELKAK